MEPTVRDGQQINDLIFNIEISQWPTEAEKITKFKGLQQKNFFWMYELSRLA